MAHGGGLLPNLFLPGVAKAGTTSLARYLGGHPDIYVPAKKEPNFYLFEREPPSGAGPARPETIHWLLHRYSVTNAEDYRSLYRDGRDAAYRLDGSVRYLYHEAALQRIAENCPKARHILVLRDPVDRMISHWRMNRGLQLEPLTLDRAIEAEDGRVADGWGWDWHYRRVSSYAPQLRRLFEYFPREQVLVLGYGDFLKSPVETLTRCFRFLQLRTDVQVDLNDRHMVPSEPRSKMLDRVLTRPGAGRGVIRRLPQGDLLLARLTRANRRPPRPVSVDGAALRATFAVDLEEVRLLLGWSSDELLPRLGTKEAEG